MSGLLPVPYKPEDLNQRFMHEPVVTRRYERAHLVDVVMDLIRDYGAPYDLSFGGIGPRASDRYIEITVDWQGRSLYHALQDLIVRSGLYWRLDDEHRLRFENPHAIYVEALSVKVTWKTTGDHNRAISPDVWRRAFGS